MTTKKNAGIWMDHASAHVMEFTDPIVTQVIVSDFTHTEKEKSLQKSESLMHNKEQQQQSAYYKKLGESIMGYNEVLLFGPTNARMELANILKADKRFDKIKIETVQAEKMTGNEEHAFVRDYFSKH